MIRAILLVLIAAASHVQAQSNKLVKAAPPEPVSLPGFDRGHCVEVPQRASSQRVVGSQRLRVCKLLAADGDVFLVEKDGQRLGSWPAEAYLGETSDFEVLRGDLDGDRDPELIVANRDSTSSGMAVNFWTIAIFPDAQFRKFEPPLTFSVEEYGSAGTFISKTRRVSILTTRWISIKDPKGKRGEGLYLLGQWWRYKSGELLPQANRSPIARRYLASFEKERLQTMSSPRKPYQWLNDPRAEPMKRELIVGRVTDSKLGVIQSVSVGTKKSSWKIVFKPDGESAIAYDYPSDEDETEPGLRFIGHAPTGQIYPDGYLPSSPDSWLNEKRATLRTHGEDTQSRKFHILWLER